MGVREGEKGGVGRKIRGRKKLKTTTVSTTPLFSARSYQSFSIFCRQFCILIVASKQSPFTFMHRHLKKTVIFFLLKRKKNATFLSRKEMKSKSLPKHTLAFKKHKLLTDG